MKIFDHWHPVLASKALKTAPQEIELGGKKITLFRNAQGKIGALSSTCPHRGMNLSFGKVQGENLSCLYHGWSFAPDGEGLSPCNPKLKVQTLAYQIREAHGYLWLTGQESQAPFPNFDILPGYTVIGRHYRRIQAPLEPVMDNFLEVEHFPTAHDWIGYGFQQINQSRLEISHSPDTVQIGFYPSEPLFWIVRQIFRLPKGFRYFMDITLQPSPAYTVHHQGFCSPDGSQKKTILINLIFYIPVNHNTTDLVMFLQSEKGNFLKNHFIRQKTGRLIDDDLVILNNLAAPQMTPAEMRLGQHDKALIEVRKRLKTIYADYYSGD